MLQVALFFLSVNMPVILVLCVTEVSKGRNNMVQDSRVKIQLSCTILLYRTQQGCQNLRLSIGQLGNDRESQAADH